MEALGDLERLRVLLGHLPDEKLQLRELCGFDPVKAEKAIPSPSAYMYVLTNVSRRQELSDLSCFCIRGQMQCKKS